MFFLVLVLASSGFAQQSSPTTSEVDMPALIRETQQQVGDPGYVGLVWWIPTRYWELSAERIGMSPEKAAERYKPLRQYTMLLVAAGKIGIGNINWFPESDVRQNTILRDASGHEYSALPKVSGDAEGLASMLKPVFSNMLGPMGQNCVILFFPAANNMAEPIADPFSRKGFSVTIRSLIAGKDRTVEWKLPLTSLSPPKYCPVGKERVQANWKYCPWHGVKLEEDVAETSRR